MKNLHEIANGKVSKALQKASAWTFSMKIIFLTNLEGFLDTRSGCPFPFALFPLFIGEKSEVVATKLAQASWVASTRRHRLLLEYSGRPKWACLLFAPSFSLSTPLGNFYWFLSETLQNFTDYATMIVFPSGMLQNFTDYTTMLVFSFWNIAKLYGLRNDACFSFQNVAKLHGLHNDACFSFQNVAKLYGLCNDACFEGSEGRKQGSRTDRKYFRTKLGYDSWLNTLVGDF